MEVVTRASSPRAGTPAPATSDRLRHREIVGRRDLDVRRLALDDMDAVAGALGESGLVGSGNRVALAERERDLQDVTPERLWRLGEIDDLAWNRLDHVLGG